jgi:peroxidase
MGKHTLRHFKLTIVCIAFIVAGCGGGGGSVNSLPNTQGQMPSVVQNVVQPLREAHPFGSTGNSVQPNSAELNIAPLDFAPGPGDVPEAGPSPRTISNVIAGGTDSKGDTGETTDPTLSAWLYLVGQFVDHDLDLEETPQSNPSFNIEIPVGDPAFPGGAVIALNRATRSSATNTIINTASLYLNLSQLYGQTPAVAATLRNANGTLKSSGNGLYLPVSGTQFITGDPRVMENPELTAITTLFMREHNYWVKTLAAQHPSWSGNQLFDMARAITIAEYQNIIYTGYLPHLIGPSVLGPYTGFDSSVNAQVTQEFSTAAFRVGHTQVSDGEEGIGPTGAVTFTETLGNGFFNTAAQDEANGIDPLLNSLDQDFAQATDPLVVPTLRNLLHADLVGGDIDIIDLIAIDIQRERDVGLGSLNDTRRALGMAPYTSFAELTSDPVLQENYENVYGNINNVDLFMGGLAEAHAPGAVVGPTFQAIIADQFRRLRSGDRYFYLNEDFDPQTLTMIKNTTLATLMARDTFLTDETGDLFIEGAGPDSVSSTTSAKVKR